MTPECLNLLHFYHIHASNELYHCQIINGLTGAMRGGQQEKRGGVRRPVFSPGPFQPAFFHDVSDPAGLPWTSQEQETLVGLASRPVVLFLINSQRPLCRGYTVSFLGGHPAFISIHLRSLVSLAGNSPRVAPLDSPLSPTLVEALSEAPLPCDR